MPFRALLEELVTTIDGAEGAILIESDGEGVQWFARGDEGRLKLRAAYAAVVMRNAGEASARLHLGQLARLVLEYEGARLVVEQIEKGYCVVVDLDPSANTAEAIHKLEPVAAVLRREILA
ncbi:MAG TPA: roadblock/LC7 domain-containing protein [Blastocatellia bacterium]|nr:roadblock/LC7 domain-containing protein [Blastocatellia bacterium]